VGTNHACFLRNTGVVSCIGSGGPGTLRLSTSDQNFGQADPPTTTRDEFSSISAGAAFTCGVRTDGSTTCWGSNATAQLQVPENCGNGVLELAEVCDDANTVSGDGCSSACDATMTCAGQTQAVIDSVCDDHNECTTQGCGSAGCTYANVANGTKCERGT